MEWIKRARIYVKPNDTDVSILFLRLRSDGSFNYVVCTVIDIEHSMSLGSKAFVSYMESKVQNAYSTMDYILERPHPEQIGKCKPEEFDDWVESSIKANNGYRSEPRLDGLLDILEFGAENDKKPQPVPAWPK